MQSEIQKRQKAILEFLPQVSKLLVGYFHKKNLKIDKKGKVDLVTEADKASEALITRTILKHFPDDSILGEEEGTKEGNSEFQWILDPLDGTTNFSHHIPLYAISIGLVHKESRKVLAGIIDLPSLGDTYHTMKNKGSFKNKKKIYVSSTKEMVNSLFCTGFPYRKDKEDVERILGYLRPILNDGRGVRRTGAAALDLAWLAEGKFDGFWEESLAPWDMTAGALLIEEAGGQVTNFNGEEFHPWIPNILASNGNIHKMLVQMFKSKKSKNKIARS
jgi:myo-inositol-1(or 4)-monophosphatase